ncbi:MAG: hypothetical protein AB2992_00730 [Candidatus Symbiodolus clandestinus]
MRSACTAKKPNFRKGIPPSQRLITEFYFPLPPDLTVIVETPPTVLSNLVASSSTPDARARFSMLMASSTETTNTLTASSVQSTVSTPILLLPHSLSPPSTVWQTAYSHPSMRSSAHSLNQANLYLPLALPKNSASATHTPVGTPRLLVNSDRLAQTINAASSPGSAIINAPGPARRSNNPAWPNCYSNESSPQRCDQRSK